MHLHRYNDWVKKQEVEMAEFLEALKAPQSRRILEKLATEDMSIETLTKKTKFSNQSIQLHLRPLIKAKLVSKNRTGLLKINMAKFNQIADWFKSISN
jgi:DNA-binding transcriptional ArsR family regulator